MNDYAQAALFAAYSLTALALLYLALLRVSRIRGVWLSLGVMVVVGSVRRIEWVTGSHFPGWVATSMVPLAFSAALLLLVGSILFYALRQGE